MKLQFNKTKVKADSIKEMADDKRNARGNVRVSTPEEEREVDEVLGLQQVTIRLQKHLVDALKELAKDEGIGYQPMVRQILTKYVKQCAKEKELATR